MFILINYRLEVEQLRLASYIKVILQCFKIFHTRLALFISILSYILLGNAIDVQKVNTVLNS